MKTSIRIIILCIIVLFSIFFHSCGDDTPNFDRSGFLSYYASNELQPRIEALSLSCDLLLQNIITLKNDPSEQSLIAARQSYISSMINWQKANFMNFGPGAKDGLRLTLQDELALWPLSTGVIELKIESKEFDLDDSWRNSRGLMTIEYLLYSSIDLDEALATLTEDRLNYLLT